MRRLRTINNYLWFIKESQSFMKGTYNPVKIFILSLFKGVSFCRKMNKYYKLVEVNKNESK